MMKIGLIDVDGKMPNIALMKISAWNKFLGHDVVWFDPLFGKYDIVYGSKIFKFSPGYEYIPDGSIWGGTGLSLETRLDETVESVTSLDYSMYPQCDYTMQMFSRGCIRKCSFCVVPEKEGSIRAVEPLESNARGTHVEVLDNNFFGNPEWEKSVEWLLEEGQPVNLHGVDVRILTEAHAQALLRLKHMKQIHIAWDDAEVNLRPKLEEVLEWIHPSRLMCYVLIGFDSTEEQDLYRVEMLRELKIDPFVMPMNKGDYYQKRFARWVNHKAIWKTVKWKDYSG